MEVSYSKVNRRVVMSVGVSRNLWGLEFERVGYGDGEHLMSTIQSLDHGGDT